MRKYLVFVSSALDSFLWMNQFCAIHPKKSLSSQYFLVSCKFYVNLYMSQIFHLQITQIVHN